MNEFIIYAEGPVAASVCTSLTDEEASHRMPASGTRNGWQLSTDDFADGTPNGSPCNHQPGTHRHLLFKC